MNKKNEFLKCTKAYVLRLLSWASSSIITEYWLSIGLAKLSRRRTPSVRYLSNSQALNKETKKNMENWSQISMELWEVYLMQVFSEVLSSNLMAYPTSSPRRTPSSCATRLWTVKSYKNEEEEEIISERDQMHDIWCCTSRRRRRRRGGAGWRRWFQI